MLSDRVLLSSAEARVEKIKGGSVGVGDGIVIGFHEPTSSPPVLQFSILN